jgi:hypothetical protein
MRLLERRVERLEKDAGGLGGTILLVVDQAEGWLARRSGRAGRPGDHHPHRHRARPRRMNGLSQRLERLERDAGPAEAVDIDPRLARVEQALLKRR